MGRLWVSSGLLVGVWGVKSNPGIWTVEGGVPLTPTVQGPAAWSVKSGLDKEALCRLHGTEARPRPHPRLPQLSGAQCDVTVCLPCGQLAGLGTEKRDLTADEPACDLQVQFCPPDMKSPFFSVLSVPLLTFWIDCQRDTFPQSRRHLLCHINEDFLVTTSVS